MTTNTFRMRARGPFSLTAAARFTEGFPAGQGGGDRARLDLAFPAEGSWATVGTFPDVGRRDPVVRDLQARYPGLRPIQFHSPYEAAAWTIIGHRIRMTQAAAIKNRLAEELGDRVDFGDRTLPAFPAPERLASLVPPQGLTAVKVDQLRALGRAAAGGLLDADLLRGQHREQALAHLRTLPGVGPFSAELILLRGAGDPDAFPAHEKRLHRAMATAYDLGPNPDVETLAAVAERWRPFRMWVALLLRAAQADAA